MEVGTARVILVEIDNALVSGTFSTEVSVVVGKIKTVLISSS